MGLWCLQVIIRGMLILVMRVIIVSVRAEISRTTTILYFYSIGLSVVDFIVGSLFSASYRRTSIFKADAVIILFGLVGMVYSQINRHSKTNGVYDSVYAAFFTQAIYFRLLGLLVLARNRVALLTMKVFPALRDVMLLILIGLTLLSILCMKVVHDHVFFVPSNFVFYKCFVLVWNTVLSNRGQRPMPGSL